MRFLLALCAIGIFISWFGLYAQMAYYFHAEAVREVAKTHAIVTDDPVERRLSHFIPDEKSAAFAKNAFAHHREIGQQMADTVSMIGSNLKTGRCGMPVFGVFKWSCCRLCLYA